MAWASQSLYARMGGEKEYLLFDGRQLTVFCFVFAAIRRMKNGLLCKSTCILEGWMYEMMGDVEEEVHMYWVE